MDELEAIFSLEVNEITADFSLTDEDNLDAVFKIDAAGTTWGSIDGNINNQADLKNALNDLSDQIAGNHSEITNIETTMQGYGDIVSHNATEFATATEGTLASTALQPGDNITELNNNAGYITGIDYTAVTTALGYVPQPELTEGYGINISGNTISTDTTIASKTDIGNAQLIIKRNNTPVGTFSANATEAATVTISVPTTATEVGALPSDTTINDLTTTAQQAALNSGANTTNIGQISTNTSDISTINGKIPNQASSSNQLADKNFVNSSIATNTANFIGTFQSVADLEAYSGPLTNNDYAFVETTDTAGNTYYDRYKYTTATTPAEWQFEYELNNSSFTSNQWAAINSGVTSGDVTLISTATQPGDNVSTLVNDAGYLTSSSIGNGPTVFKKNGAAFATITANQTSTVNVDYTIPTTASDVGALPDSTIIGNANTTILVNSTSVGTINANQTTAGSVNISVPTDTTDLTNGAGYITGISSSDVTTALGYTPYNSSNPDGYTSNLGTVTSVNNVLPISGNVNVHTRNIGEIVISTLPLTDAGLHLLDGSLIQYGSYSAFIDYIADIYDSGDYPDLFDTEANWQSAVAAHSVCGKFVYDSVNNTVRLPKITGIIEGTTDLTALGALVEAGLPNITGATSYVFNSSDSTVAGALHNDSYVSSYGVAPSSSGTNKARTLTFDASDSNSIYGNSATVQPQTIKTLYYIVIAALSKTEIEVDIDEIATDLNGKADTDLTNLTATASPNIDGQWVITDTIINNNANKAIGTYYFPLSSYLPNDGYKYEVMVHLYGASSSSAASTAVLAVWSDIFTLPGTSASYAQVIATTTTRVGTSDFTLPVGDERKIYYQIFSNEFATIYMRLYGYRRIGTNS